MRLLSMAVALVLEGCPGVPEGDVDSGAVGGGAGGGAQAAGGGQGEVDAGASDAGAPDAGSSDAGVDAGAVDAGQADAGADAGCLPSALVGTIAQFTDPVSTRAAAANAVLRVNAVATSGKFLLSKTATRCTYALFVADPNTAVQPYTGLLVTSVVDNVNSVCAADVLPNNVVAGDFLDIAGTYSPFTPSAAACGGLPPNPPTSPQLRATCLSKTGVRPVPTPAPVAVNGIVDGGTQWANALVSLSNVVAKTATAPGDSTFGTFTLQPAGFPVGAKIYFRGAATNPTVAIGQQFAQVVGLPLLDVCTWTLEPRSWCDFTPALGDAGCP